MTRLRTERSGDKAILLGKRSGGSEYYYSQSFAQCLDELHRGPPYKTGGPCLIKKIEYFAQPSQYFDLVGIGSPRRTYQGNFVPTHYTASGQAITLPGSTLLQAQNSAAGATGWKKYRPGNPTASVGQAVGEAHKIPTIPFRSLYRRAITLKKLGSEYLNVQFGWFPFLNDLRQAVKTAWDIDNALKQLRIDNGQNVRRRGTISSTESSSSGTFLDSMRPVLTSEFYPTGAPTPTANWTDRTTVTHYFSAKFRYWIPDIDSPDWEGRAKRILFGTNLTPSLVWELTPWSWLIDWETNIGDVLSNLSSNAAENLVAVYAYAMTKSERTVLCSVHRTVRTLFPLSIPYEAHASSGFTETVYIRSAANPYGFGLTFADLNDRQMLILTALGLSRHG